MSKLALTKADQPGVCSSFQSLWQPSSPKVGILAAHGDETGKAGGLFSEDHGVPVFPQVPKTEQEEGRRRVARDSSRSAIFRQSPNISIGGEDEADFPPEPASKRTLEEDVVGSLEGGAADGAASFLNGEHTPLQQGMS